MSLLFINGKSIQADTKSKFPFKESTYRPWITQFYWSELKNWRRLSKNSKRRLISWSQQLVRWTSRQLQRRRKRVISWWRNGNLILPFNLNTVSGCTYIRGARIFSLHFLFLLLLLQLNQIMVKPSQNIKLFTLAALRHLFEGHRQHRKVASYKGELFSEVNWCYTRYIVHMRCIEI